MQLLLSTSNGVVRYFTCGSWECSVQSLRWKRYRPCSRQGSYAQSTRPFLTNNYWVLTMNSVLSNVLEGILWFSTSQPVCLLQACWVCRCHLCVQELIARYMNDSSTMHMCLFDLKKAFDSVEFPVLLDQLFSFGINGKTWRLIRK